ncbi:hypothetical protein ADK67_48270 [Saccharothrix sp. NRRL B-16348]|uniref:hypothetical protein n=1 Tax=Saccharothrix sp. NRRL B-16348 TaxID=1415542 RepID=UPI0006ADD613|nr:hypothetical protein [Saccharothrix sp. NRRL B-16348]KOX11863.1 hypothetical protein ADK67_48270 [Saccharothrix sp. NRRL B-16348]
MRGRPDSPPREHVISISTPLPPAVGAPRALTDVYGPGVAVCARPAVTAGNRHRNTVDALSARPIAVAGDTTVICSAGGTDPALLAQLRDGGLPVGDDLRDFRDEAGFAARVAEAMADGLPISMEYPHPTALCPDERVVKTAHLVGYLNNKATISTFVAPRFHARRSVVTRADLDEAAPAEKSWVLKAATNDAHGGSLDVYLHEAGDQVAFPAFTDLLGEFVIEEYLYLARNWGVQLYVGPDAVARLLAVTEQRVDDTGVYVGGRFGLVSAPPADLLAECLAITQRAADVGYRGLCSLDCAETLDGQLVMLDLNFRITSGSIPLLALQSVRPDALDGYAESLKLTAAAPLADLLAHVRPALNAGGVLITSGHDTTRTDNPVVLSTLQLLVFGDDPDDVTARRSALELTR